MDDAVTSLAWIGAQSSVAVAMAITTAGPAWRKSLGGLLLALVLVLLWASPDEAPLRFLLALGTVLAALRYVDLVRARRDIALPVRVWQILVPADVRDARKVARRFDTRTAASGLAYATGAVVGAIVTYYVAPAFEGWAHWLVRWSGGLLFGYCAFDTAVSVLLVSHRALGFEVPTPHEKPILSRTVSEFCARRWNRTVHRWLSRHCFRPFARLGRPRLGIVAAFVVSALIHIWMAAAALDLWMTLSTGAFFLLQGGIVLAEQRLHIGRFPRVVQHAWTVGWMFGTSPLFVEPFIRFNEPLFT